MVRAMRQRERVNERVWTPLHPEFFTIHRGGTIYSRTWPHITVVYNQVRPALNDVPYGFTFAPNPDPPYVALTPSATISSAQTVGDLAGGVGVGGSGTLLPPITAATPLAVHPVNVTVGTGSKPLNPVSLVVLRVTIHADPGNTGVIWVSDTLGDPAGKGIDLPAGAAKDYGDLTQPRGVDLGQLFLRGTAAGDKVNCSYEV